MAKATVIYGTDVKQEARNFLFDHADGMVINRAFTLPSRDAICAREMKKRFGCHVVGVDMSDAMVRFYDSDAVDEMYKGNAFHLANKESTYQMAAVGQTIDRRGRRITSGEHRIMPFFDLMFLDFTQHISTDNINLISQIMANYAAAKSVIGVTFNEPREMQRSEVELLLRKLRPKGWEQDTLFYKNARSSMLLTVLVNR